MYEQCQLTVLYRKDIQKRQRQSTNARYASNDTSGVNIYFATSAPTHRSGHTNAVRAMGPFSVLMF
jgi:hypothetical protein